MRKTTKSYMTLIEVLIAMSLLSVILVVTFGFFQELSVVNQKTDKVLKESFQKRYVESRLSYVFSHILNESKTDEKFYFLTMTEDEFSNFPSLVLSFNNQTVYDSKAAAHVLARLFVNKEKKLCLAIWPMPIKKKDQPLIDPRSYIKIECLLDEVNDFKLKLYSPPDLANTKETDKPIRGEWNTHWQLKWKEMPAIVEMELEIGEKRAKQTFAFVLPSSKHPVEIEIKK